MVTALESRRAATKRWQAANPDRVRAASARYKSRNPEKVVDYKLRRMGLSLDDYADMLRAQGNGCAICGITDNGTNPNGEARRFHVDHDHECCPAERACDKCVRGLLCRACNMALGMFNDDIERLLRAALYLESHRHGRTVTFPVFSQDRKREGW